MHPLSERKASHEGERGAVLVIVAMSMVAIMLIVALVIDFGFVRNTRQSNKSDADVAVTAGLHGLESADGIPRPWAGVCAAATYALANRSDGASLAPSYADGDGNVITGNPCADPARLNQPCVPPTPATPTAKTTWARMLLTDPDGLQIDIRSGYVTPDPDFPEDAASYVGDDGASIWGGCDQLAVIVTEGDAAYFGGVAGSGGYDTRIRSVGRVTIGSITSEVVALLLLEQTECQTLVTSGNNTFVHVRATPIGAPTRPGLIHANSNGTTGCSGSSRAIEGSSACSAITNCGTAGPSIVAGNVSAAIPGRVGVRAVSAAPSFATTPSCPDPAAPTSGCTISPAPSDRGLVTRESVDARYLQRARNLKATASTETGRSSASATAAGYAVFANCNTGTLPVDGAGRTSSAVAGSSRIFISGNCSASTVLFDSTITDIVISGSLSVGSGGILEAPSVRRFFVRNGVGVQGTLSVNRGTSSSCAARTSAAPSAVTAFVVSSGPLDGGAQTDLRMCSTFLFLADGPLPTVNGTAPANNTSTGRINLGAQTRLDWTAPNQTSLAIPNTDPLYDDFEDLALWTEFSGSCSAGSGPGIGGQGSVTATGIFFLPNACPFNIAGGGSGAVINADAQFIVRRMRLSGTVALTMAPNPANAVPTPKFETFSLVR